MRKAKFTFFILLVTAFLIGSLAISGEKVSAQPKTPGEGKGPEPGMTPGHGYHHRAMPSSGETKRAKEILDKPVFSQDNQMLGTLYDLVIFGKGMVHYGILALEEQKGRYTAIPFNYLESSDEKNALVLEMKHLKVIGAPSFSLEEITDWDNSEIGEKVHRYFGM